MDERKTLALQAVRELLNPNRDDWDELVAMTRRNARIVAECLREAGWKKRAISTSTKLGPHSEFLAGRE
jgi:hypothetical protein